jgi:hypothetical protein
MAAFMILRRASPRNYFCRARRCEPSQPLQRALGRESRGPSLYELVCGLLVIPGLLMLGRFPVVASGMCQMF